MSNAIRAKIPAKCTRANRDIYMYHYCQSAVCLDCEHSIRAEKNFCSHDSMFHFRPLLCEWSLDRQWENVQCTIFCMSVFFFTQVREFQRVSNVYGSLFIEMIHETETNKTVHFTTIASIVKIIGLKLFWKLILWDLQKKFALRESLKAIAASM